MLHNKMNNAWAAGIFEGEGYIFVTKKLIVEADVTNTDIVLLNRLKDLFGGDITSAGKTKNRLIVRHWRIANRNCLKFLKLIYPYLIGNKKEQVAKALEIEPLIGTQRIKLSDYIREQRSKIREQLVQIRNQQKIYATY